MEATAGVAPTHRGFVPISEAKILEATGGIEPPYKGFADPRLTTWLRGQNWTLFIAQEGLGPDSPLGESRILDSARPNRDYVA